jgi:hypothetical protein
LRLQSGVKTWRRHETHRALKDAAGAVGRDE